MFVNVFAKVMVAVPHRSGVCPFQINFVTAAFLDWIFMLVNGHVVSLFSPRVLESLSRMKVRLRLLPHAAHIPHAVKRVHDEKRGVQKGYESRSVPETVFVHTMEALMHAEETMIQDNDRNWFIQPAVDATLASRYNPLAMTQVPPCFALAPPYYG
jgi:hypothetical protein